MGWKKRHYEPDELSEGTDRGDVEAWLEEVEGAANVGVSNGSDYNDWELEFIESVRAALKAKPDDPRPLSGKQLVILKQLHDRA